MLPCAAFAPCHVLCTLIIALRCARTRYTARFACPTSGATTLRRMVTDTLCDDPLCRMVTGTLCDDPLCCMVTGTLCNASLCCMVTSTLCNASLCCMVTGTLCNALLRRMVTGTLCNAPLGDTHQVARCRAQERGSGAHPLSLSSTWRAQACCGVQAQVSKIYFRKGEPHSLCALLYAASRTLHDTQRPTDCQDPAACCHGVRNRAQHLRT
jgi:hypothetical protein